MKRNRLWLALLALAITLPLVAQQQTQPQKDLPDEAGFVAIFDGKTLDGWEGDTKYWRVENGALVGEITPGNTIQENTFIIYKGGPDKGLMKDFELKLEYRISDRGNSGINYRSSIVEGKPFVMKGYQFDIDGPLKNSGTTRHTANNYDEKGRTFMALRGQVTRATEGGKRQVIGTLGEYADMTRYIKNDDWNTVHLIARGNTLIHMLNGQVMSILIDDDPAGRAMEGLLGVQVHTGPPMKIEYRNVRVKKLEPALHVLSTPSQLDRYLGQIVTVRGEVSNTKVPGIIGVDVDLDGSVARGEQAEATGLLRRWVVTAEQIEAAYPPIATRGPGVYYRLQKPGADGNAVAHSVWPQGRSR